MGEVEAAAAHATAKKSPPTLLAMFWVDEERKGGFSLTLSVAWHKLEWNGGGDILPGDDAAHRRSGHFIALSLLPKSESAFLN